MSDETESANYFPPYLVRFEDQASRDAYRAQLRTPCHDALLDNGVCCKCRKPMHHLECKTCKKTFIPIGDLRDFVCAKCSDITCNDCEETIVGPIHDLRVCRDCYEIRDGE